MQHRPRLGACLLAGALPPARGRRRWRLSASGRRPRAAARRSALRTASSCWRRQVEEVHVTAGDRAIQLVEPAARDDDQPLGRHAVRVLEPAQERYPVQDLVADLRQPRPDHDGPGPGRHVGDLRARSPAPRRGTPGVPAPGRCGARSGRAACARTAGGAPPSRPGCETRRVRSWSGHVPAGDGPQRFAGGAGRLTGAAQGLGRLLRFDVQGEANEVVAGPGVGDAAVGVEQLQRVPPDGSRPPPRAASRTSRMTRLRRVAPAGPGADPRRGSAA